MTYSTYMLFENGTRRPPPKPVAPVDEPAAEVPATKKGKLKVKSKEPEPEIIEPNVCEARPCCYTPH